MVCPRLQRFRSYGAIISTQTPDPFALPFFVPFVPFRGYSCLSLNLCVFASLREIFLISLRSLRSFAAIKISLSMSATNGTPTLTNATVTPEGYRALWGAAIGYAMDGFDLLILGFMLRQIGHDLNLNAAQAASLVTATLIGAVIG